MKVLVLIGYPKVVFADILCGLIYVRKGQAFSLPQFHSIFSVAFFKEGINLEKINLLTIEKYF